MIDFLSADFADRLSAACDQQMSLDPAFRIKVIYMEEQNGVTCIDCSCACSFVLFWHCVIIPELAKNHELKSITQLSRRIEMLSSSSRISSFRNIAVAGARRHVPNNTMRRCGHLIPAVVNNVMELLDN